MLHTIGRCDRAKPQPDGTGYALPRKQPKLGDRAPGGPRVSYGGEHCAGPLVSLTRQSIWRRERHPMPETTAQERDARHLLRAIELATEARGNTSPNPMVGAVLVKGGRVIGEGITQPPGEAHAERMALAASDEDPAGGTLYVSLEPCCHHGRTEPCTDAILEAGIARVVIASDDPTPKASGRGPGILRDEGVEVEFVDGELADAARTAVQALEAAGVDVIVATGANEAARVQSALDELGSREIQSLLLEGGPHLAGAFLEAGAIDEVRIFVAPLLVGGREARTTIEGLGIQEIAAAGRAVSIEVDRIEDDVLVIGRLREW